jgi:prophage tail gpP-like protein
MDNIKVLVNGQVFENFEQARIYSDLYSIADTFSFSGIVSKTIGSDYYNGVTCGLKCRIFINNALVMNGIIMDTRLSAGEDGTRFDFSGFDMCGWISALTVKDFSDFNGSPVAAAAIIAELRAQIPQMNDISVIGLETLAVMEDVTISTGQQLSSVFNMIADKTNSIFYALPSGVITFGKKTKTGVSHNIAVGRDNVKSAVLKTSIRDAANAITYICEDDELATLARQTVVVPALPPLGVTAYSRVSSKQGELLHLAQAHANDMVGGYKRMSVEYHGFSDRAGGVWRINNGVAFSDATKSGLGNSIYVIESVEFSQTRNEGQVATLEMSLPAIY